uniref:Uncharacterized protein n=1 Tax=Macrostomum lignano TaxID=282301 RepID=A0A1I8FEQ3_9PLAT
MRPSKRHGSSSCTSQPVHGALGRCVRQFTDNQGSDISDGEDSVSTPNCQVWAPATTDSIGQAGKARHQATALTEDEPRNSSSEGGRLRLGLQGSAGDSDRGAARPILGPAGLFEQQGSSAWRLPTSSRRLNPRSGCGRGDGGGRGGGGEPRPQLCTD